MKKFFTKWLPTDKDLEKHRYLQIIMARLRHAPVWRVDRRSLAKGLAIGLFVCYLPLPCQMLLSAVLACFFRANVSLAILMTWISNPFTFVPITFFICQVGAWVLATKNTFPQTLPNLEWTHESVKTFAYDLYLWFYGLGKVYVVGLPIVALGSALLGYMALLIGWRWMVYWQRRRRVKR